MNIFVAGSLVGRDWELISQISRGHVVTIAQDPRQVSDHPLLGHACLLLLDCSEDVELCLQIVKDLDLRTSGLPVVLVDGGIEQKELAIGFASGIADYFAAPYDIELLVERINVLCVKLTERLHQTSKRSIVKDPMGDEAE